MKLATLRDGTRDGRLVVVSRDLTRAVSTPGINTLQQALDHWTDLAPQLMSLSDEINAGKAPGSVAFRSADCLSPLPRAYQWADGSAYVNHVELVRRARGAELPQAFWTDPLMYQGGSDAFLAPTEQIWLADESLGCDLEAEVAVVVGDVAQGTRAEQVQSSILLLMLVNDVSLRNLIPSELSKGFGFFQSKPSSAFSPCAVTTDELGLAWDGGRLHLPLISHLNGEKLGEPNAGVDMTFDFRELVAHAAKTRRLAAGTIIGSGTVSNRSPDGGPGCPVSEGGAGYSCLAELRMVETLRHGAPRTRFLAYGDRIRIEMFDSNGQSVFGAIDQSIEALPVPQSS